MRVWEWLGFKAGERDEPERIEGLACIVEVLQQLPRERGRRLAMWAYLLARVARADSAASSSEMDLISEIIARRAQLPPEEAKLVVELAQKRQAVFGGTENFLVGRAFGQEASREEKLALLDCLFAVSAAEGGITTIEDNEIRQISREIGLEHRDYIAVRSRYRDQLRVLWADEEVPGHEGL